MKTITPRQFGLVLLIVASVAILRFVSFVIYLFTHPTDYAQIEEVLTTKIGSQYDLNIEKATLFKKLNPRHPYSDTIKNLRDSIFVFYFHPSNDTLELKALVRIVRKDINFTVIYFDSIVGYEYNAGNNSADMEKIVSNYDSLEYTAQFYKNVIQQINPESTTRTDVYFDNKLIMDTYKSETICSSSYSKNTTPYFLIK